MVWSRSWRMWLSQMLSTVPTLAPSQLPCGWICVSISSRTPISMLRPSSSGRLLTCSVVMVSSGAVMPPGYHRFGGTLHPICANHKLHVVVGYARRYSLSRSWELVVQRELRGLEGFALQIPSSVGVRGAALPPLAPPPNRVFRGPEAPEPPFGSKVSL